jgi:hypothetical protein
MRKLLRIMCLAACLASAWAETTLDLRIVRQPSTMFVVGPGTVVSVHLLDLPFIRPRYAVRFKTDDGKMIEVWHPANDILVVPGMHGVLTYTTHPEMIRRFCVDGKMSPK